MPAPEVIITGFADEGPVSKLAEEQFTMLRALGMSYYSPRFIDLGSGVKNVLQLTKAELRRLRKLHEEFEVQPSSVGSPIGKVKLRDVEDGTKNKYVPFARYLAGDVKKACKLAHALECKLIRGFSFYHPRGTDPRDHMAQVVDQFSVALGRTSLLAAAG